MTPLFFVFDRIEERIFGVYTSLELAMVQPFPEAESAVEWRGGNGTWIAFWKTGDYQGKPAGVWIKQINELDIPLE